MNSSSAALLKEHADFRKRGADAAAFLASNEKRQKQEKSSTQKTNRSRPAFGRSKTSDFTSDHHPTSTSSKSRLLLRAKIVEKLQERFLAGNIDAITLDEIIHESELTIDSSDKHWLTSEALLSCEQIDVKKVDDINKFVYKPPLDLKGKKQLALLNLLKARHEKCEGAITVDDVRDSIPKARADIIIDNLIKEGKVVKVPGANKKEVLFYTDPDYKIKAHPDFVESWRKISVEGMDDGKICEFLDNQGHYGLMKNAPRPSHLPKPTKRGGRRPDTMKHNQHVAHQLEDYSSTPIKK